MVRLQKNSLKLDHIKIGYPTTQFKISYRMWPISYDTLEYGGMNSFAMHASKNIRQTESYTYTDLPKLTNAACNYDLQTRIDSQSAVNNKHIGIDRIQCT